jgi:hypothetical protein
MRTLLPLVVFVALSIAGCSSASDSMLGPAEDETASACRGNSGNCGGGQSGGGQQNNNPNNPPATAP